MLRELSDMALEVGLYKLNFDKIELNMVLGSYRQDRRKKYQTI